MNEDIVVVDAEDSNANMSQKYGYDVNEEIYRMYDFQKDPEQRQLELPPMISSHRARIHDIAGKLGLQHKTLETKENAKKKDVPKGMMLTKPKNFSPKNWTSPFGPSQSKHKKAYDKIPRGANEIVENLFLGSGRDADDLEDLKEKNIRYVLNVTSEWKDHANMPDYGITFKRIVIKV